MEIKELDYLWIVFYEDGETLFQFDPKTLKEKHFGDIENKAIEKFVLYKQKDPTNRYTLNLKEGLFYDERGDIIHGDLDKSNKKLNYFRRVFIELNGKDKYIEYHMGWSNDLKDYKIIINPDGGYRIEYHIQED
jgi:hypothetical protein